MEAPRSGLRLVQKQRDNLLRGGSCIPRHVTSVRVLTSFHLDEWSLNAAGSRGWASLCFADHVTLTNGAQCRDKSTQFPHCTRTRATNVVSKKKIPDGNRSYQLFLINVRLIKRGASFKKQNTRNLLSSVCAFCSCNPNPLTPQPAHGSGITTEDYQ